MLTIIDWILDLFRDENAARAFVATPEQAMRDAGLAGVTAAQLSAVTAAALPGLALGADPVVGLQRAVANQYGFEPTYAPSVASVWAPAPTFAPETNTDLASHNDTSLMSPNQDADANAQQGAFNLGFGDITFGRKTTNTAADGGVVVAGDNGGDIVSGDGAALGSNTSAHNGALIADHSNVSTGRDNVIRDSDTTVGGGQTTTTVRGTGNTAATDGHESTTTTVTHETTITDSSTHDDSNHLLWESSHPTWLVNSEIDNSHETSLASGNHLLGLAV